MSPKGQALAEALRYRCKIELPVGPEGEEQCSTLMQGGDRAAGHTAFATSAADVAPVFCFCFFPPAHRL